VLSDAVGASFTAVTATVIMYDDPLYCVPSCTSNAKLA